MRKYYVVIYILATCTCVFETGHSNELNKCFFSNDTKSNETDKFANIISPLIGQNYVTEKNGYNYIVSICSDINKEHEFGSVTRNKNNEIVILGRRNDTRLYHGDNWLVLNYRSGDFNSDKTSRKSASLYFVCTPDSHQDQPHLDLVEEDGVNYTFIISHQNACNYNRHMSGLQIFMIVTAVTLSLYCIAGVTYKRFVQNAQHFQQIPHFTFWSRIGNRLADACNYVCRCESESEDSWNNIMNNFDGGDRDDALLRP